MFPQKNLTKVSILKHDLLYFSLSKEKKTNGDDLTINCNGEIFMCITEGRAGKNHHDYVLKNDW